MTIADGERETGDVLAEIERLRREFRQRWPARERGAPSLEQLAAGKRAAHAGGDINHRFEGERYLNCPDKTIRRFQLRKLVDEGGEQTVGGPKVSHPLLSRWESYGFGLTPEEVTELEKGDADPDQLIRRGWWIAFHRHAHWAVGIGSSLVGEGETANRSKELLAGIEVDRKRWAEMGVQDVDRALMNRQEHAGIDVDHAEFGQQVVKRFVTTPEQKDQLRRGFRMRFYQVNVRD
jgi:pyrroloquinoline quinone (PQQ) biosynthesis protein C